MHITTKMVPETILNALKTNRCVYQAARGVRSCLGSLAGSRHVPGIPGKVHFNDFMFDSTRAEDIAAYVRCAEEAIGQLKGALAMAQKTWNDVASVLEFGCGYGRITRFLAQKVAPSKITVCDVIEEGARFCGNEFGVRVVPSTADLNSFRTEPSDLVFFLSVHTHISEPRLEALQNNLIHLLTPGGVCFFTTMGSVSAANAERYGIRWARQKGRIVADLQKQGLSFHPYGYYNDPHYGMTWETRDHVTGLVRRLHGDSLRLLDFAEAAVDGHQDFYVYQRVSN